MDDEAYRLEEAVLFNRYGIVAYRTDSVDAVPTPGGSTTDPDTDIPKTAVLSDV